MANETVTTNIDELASIAIAEARLVMANRQDLRALCTKRTLNAGELSVRFPKLTNVTAAALTEGSEASLTQLTTTGVTLTPSTNAVVASLITDLANHASPQMAANFGRMAGDAIVKKINGDIIALFDGFSNAIGTTDTDITTAVLKGGVKTLLQNGAQGDIFFVFTPEVWDDWLADLASTSGGNAMLSDRAKDAILAGKIEREIKIYGATPVLVTSGVSETGDVKCGLLTEDAIGYAEAWDIKVELERAALAIGQRLVASCAYALGEIEDTAGVEVLCDGAD